MSCKLLSLAPWKENPVDDLKRDLERLTQFGVEEVLMPRYAVHKAKPGYADVRLARRVESARAAAAYSGHLRLQVANVGL